VSGARQLLLAGTLALWGCASEHPADTEPEVVVEVRTAQSKLEDVEQTISAPASIFAKSQANVASKLTAPIVQLGARKGDRVTQGQLLASLSSADLDAQVSEAKARVVDARAMLEKASAGTLPSDVERARGEVENAAATLAQTKEIFERRQELVAQGALPERDRLLAKTQYEQAQTAHRVATTSLELLTGQSRGQDIRIAQSRLAQAEAGLDFVKAQLAFARIESPSAGFVTEQFLYPGDMARPDAPIFTIMDLSVAVARAQFPEENARALRVGQLCRFVSLDEASAPHSGKLTVINQAVDPARRTVEAWCEIPNSASDLRAGLFGNVSVVTGLRKEAVTVPLTAVEFAPDRTSGVVWSLANGSASDQQVVRKNEVTTGVVSRSSVEIIEGLSSGERVVVEGGYGLTEGLAAREAEPRP
jgi:RND family efflux transporter MFP subunit